MSFVRLASQLKDKIILAQAGPPHTTTPPLLPLRYLNMLDLLCGWWHGGKGQERSATAAASAPKDPVDSPGKGTGEHHRLDHLVRAALQQLGMPKPAKHRYQPNILCKRFTTVHGLVHGLHVVHGVHGKLREPSDILNGGGWRGRCCIHNRPIEISERGLCIDQATAHSASLHQVFKSIWMYQFERSYMGYGPTPGICDPPLMPTHPFDNPLLPYFQCTFISTFTIESTVVNFRLCHKPAGQLPEVVCIDQTRTREPGRPHVRKPKYIVFGATGDATPATRGPPSRACMIPTERGVPHNTRVHGDGGSDARVGDMGGRAE
ncbi:hypothetical protein B0H14DRAFT_2615745 [Mycena olivaceomarginata]|nr:hypothetical protein B0H14DRAFT_2615745 [Mycena olivaceomarginata]